MTTAAFPHERLDAFHVAMELVLGVERLAAAWPRGHADLKDQLRRAAGATLRNLAEGANRWSPKDKAARFRIALGECGATLAVTLALRLVPPEDVHELRRLAARVASMLTGLVRRL